MTKWGTDYLNLDKPPLSALSSYEGNRREYYAQPQDMVSYRDRFTDKNRVTADKGGKQGEGVAQLWVFRVVHLTEVTLESFINRQGIEVLQIEEVSPRGAAYRSFLVTVHEKDAPTLLHKTFWPGLVSCKYWHDQTGVSKAATLSRRSSAKGSQRIPSAQGREKVIEKSRNDEEKRPPQVLPPLQKVKPKSPHPKSSARPKSNNVGRNKAKAKVGNSRPIPSSKIAKKKEESKRRGSVGKKKGNDSSESKGKNSKRDINKKEKDKKQGTKGYYRKKEKKTAEKGGSENKGQAKPKRNSSIVKAREHVKIREVGKEKDSKGSGNLGKRQDDIIKQDNSKPINVTGGEKERKDRNDRNQEDKRKQKTATKERETKPGKSSGHHNKNNYQTERKSGETRQKPTSSHLHARESREGLKGGQEKDHKIKEAQPQITVEVSVKKPLVNRDPDRRSIGEKDRSSRIRPNEDGTHSGRGYLHKQETEKDSNRQAYLLPEIPVKSPYLSATPTPRSQSRARESLPRQTGTLPDINQHRSNSQGGSKKYPNWVVPLSGLLILSPEEVVDAMLGNEFDGLLIQDVISDDELFLGVKVLAHASRAKSSEKDLQQLLRKIWQPHIIHLIKNFTVTVERLYPERAERYFWDLAEFLDLYVSRGIHIDQMPNLIDTCFMEVLALSYKSFLSEDIVKVFRAMQDRTKNKDKKSKENS